ncbi:hypothetical protein LSH36_557g01065 [Paralvinella palmiformis]|uniref:Codanin-1 C-terminal domain-containing protein n=1 Tax=Paralvinella palmiformis TaxID=53620 RepID=A0AAD9J7A9_9ANNE|nr:hypothetical protein LSH36_557g01065 [Paralvinella palmiformis]
MAAILEKLFAKELSTEQLISWLKSQKHKNEISLPLCGLENIRCEFVPFFLNYLRDQSSHLLQNSRSTNATPAKTPTTAKLRRLTTFSASQANDLSMQSGKRQQLFPASSEFKEKSSSEKDCYITDLFSTKAGSGSRRQPRNKTDRSGKSQRSIQFTDSAHKAKHKTSLGDFLKSPDIDERLRNSRVQPKRDCCQPSGQQSKKCIAKNRTGERKQKLLPESKVLDPGFSLNNENEFPPMGSMDGHNSVPEGVTVITPSRRIVPTRLVTSSKTKDNLLFKNAPVSITGSAKTRGVWGEVANRDFSQKNLSTMNEIQNKPTRRIAPTFISKKVTTSRNVFSIPTTNNVWRNPQKDDDDELVSMLPNKESPTVINQCDAGVLSAESQPISVIDLSFVTPTKPTLEQQLSVDTVIPEKAQVTHQESLDLMIKVYSFCINAFLVPNITVELYFLAQLLTVHGTELEQGGNVFNKDLDEIQYFVNIHNAVYFAVMVLSRITSILSHLERGTLHLLVNNQRIADFKPEFKEELRHLYSLVPSKALPKSLPSPVGGVSFQADTDNRKNFPNERSFHLFKKQRDGFYELLREWEDNHLVAGWSMREVQVERIQNLVGYKTELANHIHFVRLFQSQLIQMCKGDISWQMDEEDENIALLSELKQTNPKKLKRLRERLVTPALHGGPCPSPSFPGCQEFFKDFISAACNPFFNQLLSNQLLHKITELPWFPERHVVTELYPTRSKEISRFALDNLNIVDQHILYSCCPFLADSLIDICITTTTTVTDKQLQHQLEDNFFHNQPASLKKTVEFVADRVSSNHIKIYRSQILPQVFAEARQQVQQIAEDIVKLQTESTTLGQKEIQHSVDNRASKLATKAKVLCLESAPRFCSQRCQDVLYLLLPEEMPTQVWRIAALISYRQALDKVNSWLNMQITTHMFKKELLVTSDLERKVRDLTKKNHDETPNSVQAPHNLSADVPILSQSSGELISNDQPMISARCNSLMFESPIRALQHVAPGSKIPVSSENSLSYLFQAVPNSQLTCSNPVSKCIRNLSSFDKEPSFNSDASIKILSARLSKLATGDSSHGNQCLSSQTGLLPDSESSLNSSPLTERQECVDDERVMAKELLIGQNNSLQSVVNETSDNDVVNRNSTVGQCSPLKEGTEKETFTNSDSVPVCSDGNLTTETESPDGSTKLLASDIDSFNKTDNSSSTSSILTKGGSGGKKLNVSFYEDSAMVGDIDGAIFTHSTPETSPTKVICAKCSLTETISDELELFPAVSILTSPTELLISLKECVRCVIQEPGCVTASHICDLLSNLKSVFDKPDNQVVTLVFKMVAKLSVDLAFLLVLQQPDMMTPEVQDSFCMFWQILDVKNCLEFSQVLCSRHLQKLEQENQTYISFVKTIIERGLLNISLLASNANQLLNSECLNPETVAVLSKCMCDLLPSLSEDFLCCQSVHVLITRLATNEKNISRMHTLLTLLKKPLSDQCSR